MSLQSLIFKTKEVSELAWCIGSPGLLSAIGHARLPLLPDADYFQKLLWEEREFLSALDANPSEIQNHLLFEGKLILGKRFEKLLEFYFRNSKRFQLLHRGVQLKEGDLTAGEIDFIVRDQVSEEVLHIETACKFYLSTRNTKDPAGWIGVNPRDSLDLKSNKLLKQVNLTGSPAGRSWCEKNNVLVDVKSIWLKGYFFHHFSVITHQTAPRNASRNYPSGWWMRAEEAPLFFSQSKGKWALLPKESWLAPAYFGPKDPAVKNSNELIALLNSWPETNEKSMMIALLDPVEDADYWMESNRGIIVYNHWPRY